MIYKIFDLFKVPIMLVGNKCDKENDREVSKDEGQSFACQINCPFKEVSAKVKIHVPVV
jgi:GTPase KRas protein